jgi:hypothetical protein
VQTLDLVARVCDRRQHADPEDVELDQPEVDHVVLVRLQHREAAEGLLHRDPVGEIVRRQDHPRRMEGEVPGEPVDRLAQLEQLLELTGPQVRPGQLRKPLDRGRDIAGRHARERLGHQIDLVRRQPERLADLSDGHPGPEGVHHAAHRGLIAAVGVQDVVQHVLAPVRFDVDVDIGEILAAFVHEPLE